MSRREKTLQKILHAALVCLSLFVAFNHAVNYNGYTVYQLSPNTSEKFAVLKSLENVAGYDFWQDPDRNITHLMVAPEQRYKFERMMSAAQIPATLAINNVAEHRRKDPTIRNDEEKKSTNGDERLFAERNWKHFSFDEYLRYDEMLKLIDSWVVGKSIAKVIRIGVTYQGRKMIAVKLSTSDKNPVILIDGGIHAREWVAPMSVLYVLQRLLDDTKVLEKLTFYIVPLVNPDGYMHSRHKDRYWRKTMSKDILSGCRGVDANRNFDSHWNESGTDGDPCSEMYPGPKPFSELEAKALRDLMTKVRPTMYLTFHSYGGLILYPWGFTADLPENWPELHMLGQKAADEVQRLFNSKYTVGTSTNVLYPAAGGSDDWAMEKAGVPLVYCIELEDFGSHFDPPPEDLKKIVQHADTLVQVFTKHVEENYAS